MRGLGGPVFVEPNTPSVYQLWIESQGIFYMVNADMPPFLRRLGIRVYHGLSIILGTLILRRRSGYQWRNYSQKIKGHKINVTLFMEDTSKME